jgi:hypothetical protein
MNSKIRELAIKAGASEWGDSTIPATMDIEKFAELIVRECCDILFDNEFGGYQVNYVLKEHFEVE